MSHAEICIICTGTGKVDAKTCHGCGGKGWIELLGSPIPQFPPIQPLIPKPKEEWKPHYPYFFREPIRFDCIMVNC
jgi:hypothetical protein